MAMRRVALDSAFRGCGITGSFAMTRSSTIAVVFSYDENPSPDKRRAVTA
jgi:hypothetical protein